MTIAAWYFGTVVLLIVLAVIASQADTQAISNVGNLIQFVLYWLFLRYLIANLASNAARHAKAISITGHRDHRYLTVTVDDDGPGIPPDMREQVFKPFLRLDDARNQDEGGTGLGLAIARDIARSHGGDIMLGDSPMGGLRATVRIPV